MKQYLIYGTVRDWYYAQIGPEPYIDRAATKEAAIEKIAKKFYGMFKEIMDGLKMSIPSDPEELVSFLTGESEANEYRLIGSNGKGVCYEDLSFLEEHGNPGCNTDAASTVILGISEINSDTGEIAEAVKINMNELLTAIAALTGQKG